MSFTVLLESIRGNNLMKKHIGKAFHCMSFTVIILVCNTPAVCTVCTSGNTCERGNNNDRSLRVEPTMLPCVRHELVYHLQNLEQWCPTYQLETPKVSKNKCDGP